jgi:hypothetical protein
VATHTDESWLFNGMYLGTPEWNVTTFGGSRQDLPLLRGQNYTIAYRNGQMWRQKQYDQRTISLAMWTAGINSVTEQPSADQALDFTSNFYFLRRLFSQQGVGGSQLGSLTRKWREYVNGTPTLLTATALGEVAGNMSPTMSGRTRADFTVDLLLADPYFYGPAVTTPAVNLNLVNGTTVHNPGDAVIGYGQEQGNGGVPFKITLAGPLKNPTLTNVTAGVSVTLNATIPSGTTITLNVLAYTAFDQTGKSWLGSVTHKGARPWMVLVPATQANPTGSQTLALSSTGGSDSGSVTSIQFSPGYL